MKVWNVFSDVCRFWRVHNKNPLKLRKNITEKEVVSPLDNVRLFCSASTSPSSIIPSCKSIGLFSRRWTEEELEEGDEDNERKQSNTSSSSETTPFRERASTDGHLQHKPWRWRHPPIPSSTSGQDFPSVRNERRMSISMRGNNASY